MKFYHKITLEEIVTPFYRLEAFKSFLAAKYGEDFKGSQLSDEEINLLSDMKEALKHEATSFVAMPCEQRN